ncbi:beta-lactamase family protein [Streptomyces sp. A3M-1-3]|uniref:serine hydrolase domain-containing protein n=1 Tax=Streptomyces sp. A3M-1-3 TaxID=2962044 RepID=UPI0020B6700C|nr:serine hydrolase domain-containing protein [Streptomyces sp. A3M-1-3]MCP3816825.1 beta-lactamase family protein [Streptomyces sp. A3M-1-3]
MVRTILAALAAVLLVCAGTAPGRTTAQQDDFDPVTVERLDKTINEIMERADIPGVNIGLWIPGRGTYVKSFGVSDQASGTPMKSDLHMRIGSLTKTFTITGVLQLVDRGKVGLDDPIAEYVAGVPEGDRITLRELAGMRSGLFDYSEDNSWMRSLLADPQRTWTPRQLLDYAFAHPLNFPPGTKWEYSNTNTILLGLVIEKVTGQPLGAYLEQQVYEPLKLAGTSFPTNNAMPDPYAQGYTDFTEDGTVAEATNWNPSWAWAAGAMISDLNDLHTWVPALADGRLLAPETQKQRLAFRPIGYPDVSYGLGIMRVNDWIGHNGDLPGYETLAVQLPSRRATLVILINSDVNYKGDSLSTTLGRAVTSIVTPDHVFDLPAEAQAKKSSPPPSSP